MVRPKPEIVYENTVPAIFVQRNNRFTAEVMVGNEQKTVYIKNTGRLEELLVPKAKVTLQKSEDPERKTEYDLISVDYLFIEADEDHGSLQFNEKKET